MRVDFDGDIVDVDDNATPEQLDAYYQQHRRAKHQQATRESARQTFEGVNPVAKFAIGVGAAAAEPVMGLKQAGLKALGRDTSGIEEQIATVRGAREAAGNWGTAGEVAGFIGGGAAKAPQLLAKGISKLPQAMQSVTRMLAPAALEQGGYEASKGTLEGDPSRLKRGAVGAAGGAAGAGVGKYGTDAARAVAGRLARPVRVSPEARNLIERGNKVGFDPTMSLGQAAGRDSGTGAVEHMLSKMPFVGPGITRMREEGVENWNRVVLNEIAAPLLKNSTAAVGGIPSGSRGIETVQDLVDKRFRESVAGVTIQVPKAFDPTKRTRQIIAELPEEEAKIAEAARARLVNRMQEGKLTGDAIIEERSKLRQRASEQYRKGNYTLGDALEQLDDDFRDVLPHFMSERQQGLLSEANSAYSRLKPVQRAAAYKAAIDAGNRFTPSQLVGGITRDMPDSVKARGAEGEGFLAETVEAGKTFGTTLPAVGPGTAEKLATAGVLMGGGAAAAGMLEGDLPGPGWAAPLAAYALLGTKAGRKALAPELASGRLGRTRTALAMALEADAAKRAAKRAGAAGGARAGAISLSDMLANTEEE